MVPTGAFGWLNRDGDLDLNILIRTAEVDGHQVSFRTGASWSIRTRTRNWTRPAPRPAACARSASRADPVGSDPLRTARGL